MEFSIIQKTSSLIYQILGPKNAFKLAMSPLGKYFFNLFASKSKRLVVKTKYNFSLEISRHEYYMSGYFFLKETNPFETHFLRKILKKNDVFIDAGAHIGWYSLNASLLIGDKGRVIAFEPNPECINQFKNNILRNKFNNIILEKSALGDKSGISKFWIGDDMGGSLIKNNTLRLSGNKNLKTINVKVKKLDDYCKEKKIKNIKLIKIDVEGFELSVLKGALEILKKQAPALMIEVLDECLKENGESKKKLLDFLRKLGYVPYKFVASGVEKADDEKLSSQAVNLFFCKKIPD